MSSPGGEGGGPSAEAGRRLRTRARLSPSLFGTITERAERCELQRAESVQSDAAFGWRDFAGRRSGKRKAAVYSAESRDRG